MKEPTMEEVLKLVEFDRNSDGSLLVRNVYGNVWGNVCGNVETPKERAIRLIREGKGEEAIKVLEGE